MKKSLCDFTPRQQVGNNVLAHYIKRVVYLQATSWKYLHFTHLTILIFLDFARTQQVSAHKSIYKHPLSLDKITNSIQSKTRPVSKLRAAIVLSPWP